MAFDDDKKRDEDEPVVKWDDHEWGKPSAFSTPAVPAPAPPPRLAQPVELDSDPPPRSKKSKKARRDEAPQEEGWHNEARPGTADSAPAVAAATGPLVGRGLLMLIAAGYLFWVAALCYGTLGELHREAAGASGARVVELQKTHEKIATLTFANAGAGGLFALAGLLLLAGKRGTGKTLVFFGAVSLIAFIYLHFKHAQPYLRELDLLIKLIILGIASLSIRR